MQGGRAGDFYGSLFRTDVRPVTILRGMMTAFLGVLAYPLTRLGGFYHARLQPVFWTPFLNGSAVERAEKERARTSAKNGAGSVLSCVSSVFLGVASILAIDSGNVPRSPRSSQRCPGTE